MSVSYKNLYILTNEQYMTHFELGNACLSLVYILWVGKG